MRHNLGKLPDVLPITALENATGRPKDAFVLANSSCLPPKLSLERQRIIQRVTDDFSLLIPLRPPPPHTSTCLEVSTRLEMVNSDQQQRKKQTPLTTHSWVSKSCLFTNMFHLETVGEPLKDQAHFRRLLERERIIFSPPPLPQNTHWEAPVGTIWSRQPPLPRPLRNNLPHQCIRPLARVV